MSALRDNGGYIGHYPTEPGGVFGINAIATRALVGFAGVVAAYSTSNVSNVMSATITDVKAGDQILAFICEDNSGPTASGVWTEQYSSVNAVQAQLWTAVADTDGDVVYSVTGSSRTATVFLHCRGLDLTDIVSADNIFAGGSSFVFPALAAQTGRRLVIAAGYLDDDRTTTLDAAPPGDYIGRAASQSFGSGSSMHVYTKETDGSAESSVTIDHNGNDSYTPVVFSIGLA